jgi:hypothetical protein
LPDIKKLASGRVKRKCAGPNLIAAGGHLAEFISSFAIRGGGNGNFLVGDELDSRFRNDGAERISDGAANGCGVRCQREQRWEQEKEEKSSMWMVLREIVHVFPSEIGVAEPVS